MDLGLHSSQPSEEQGAHPISDTSLKEKLKAFFWWCTLPPEIYIFSFGVIAKITTIRFCLKINADCHTILIKWHKYTQKWFKISEMAK